MLWLRKTVQWIATAPGVFHILLFTQLAVISILLVHPFTVIQPGHVYTVIERNFFYPNLILQGKEGAWKILDTHTTLATPRVFVYSFFVILGKIAAIFQAEPVWVYLWARIIAGILLFYATLWFIYVLLPKNVRALAVLLTLGVETGPLITDLPRFTTLIEQRIMIIRHFDLPHHVFSEASGIVFIGLLFLNMQKPTVKKIILMMVACVLSVISQPAHIFTFVLSVFPIWILWSVLKKNIQQLLTVFIPAALAFGLPCLLFSSEIAKGPPWNTNAMVEKTWFTTSFIRIENVSQLLLYTPLLLLAVLLFPYMWRTWDNFRKLVVVCMISWLVGPFIWVAFAKSSWFPMPNWRLTDGFGYLPAGILAALTVQFIISRFHKKSLQILTGAVLLGIIFIPSLFFSGYFIKQYYDAQKSPDMHDYPTVKLWDGIQFVKTLPKGSGILLREPYGEILPAFANIRAYVGGNHDDLDWLQRKANAVQFFSGQMTDAEARTFLTQSDISYVFYGPDEKAVNQTGALYPDLLTAVFENSDISIYKPSFNP